MVQIMEVDIISVDKGDDSWAIEGEIVFESDLSAPFEATYLPDDDEFEEFQIEINPGKYDTVLLKNMIVEAAQDYEE